MELINIAAEEKRSPQRFSRSGRNQKAVTTNILEAISQFSGGEMPAAEDGRVRIMMKKEDLKQVLEAIRDGRSLGRRNSAATAEQRLSMLVRRQLLRAASQVKCRGRGSWRPALQSIPEEL